MRHTLSAVLDLTAVSLAGGAGVHQALNAATAVGEGPHATLLHRAVRDANLLPGLTLWQSLDQLGEQLDVIELRDLATTAELAGGEGARIRASLIARADALRTQQLAADEADATTNTERMAIPLALLALAFLVFLVYPALTTVMRTLG